MFFNSISFYTYLQLDNCSLCLHNPIFYKPEFKTNFTFSVSDKKKIMQTAELLTQFFLTRPAIRAHKKFDRISSFSVSAKPNFSSLLRALRVIYAIRQSSRKKLITFKSKRNGFIYIVFKDFVTLYPFKLRSYDFHDWRSQLVMVSISKFSRLSEFEKYNAMNFYYTFYVKI